MHIVSVQTGLSRPSNVANMGATAIVKEPVPTAQVTTDGLVGDVIVDTHNHGGPDQAVYIYTNDDYDWWADKLGQTCEPGYFGENLTFSTGLASEAVRIGDRYQIGDVLLEVTAPRIPCNIFADRVGQPDFVQQFREADRPGMYCRVLNEGSIEPQDQIVQTPAPTSNLSLVDCYRLHYNRSASAAEFEAALRSPVSERMKDELERRLARVAG